MSLAETHPKYIDLWPVYQNSRSRAGRSRRDGDPQGGRGLPGLGAGAGQHDAELDVREHAPDQLRHVRRSAPEAGSTPGDHPNAEPYYILEGTLHLSNPDTSDVIELHAGDAVEHPGLGLPPRLQLRRGGLPDPLVGPGEMHTDLFKQKVAGRHAARARLVRAHAGRPERRARSNEGFESRIDQLAQWPNDDAKTDVDMVRIDRAPLAALCRATTRARPRSSRSSTRTTRSAAASSGCRGNRSAQSDSLPVGEGPVRDAGDGRRQHGGLRITLKAEPGDAIFIPANERHTFMALGSTGARAVVRHGPRLSAWSASACCFSIRPGTGEEFDRRHREAWPELLAALRELRLPELHALPPRRGRRRLRRVRTGCRDLLPRPRGPRGLAALERLVRAGDHGRAGGGVGRGDGAGDRGLAPRLARPALVVAWEPVLRDGLPGRGVRDELVVLRTDARILVEHPEADADDLGPFGALAEDRRAAACAEHLVTSPRRAEARELVLAREQPERRAVRCRR